MKFPLLFAALSLLLSFGSCAQALAWPHNQQTGQIAFSGLVPWPMEHQSASARTAWIRHWYLTAVTDVKPATIAAWVAEGDTPLTYASLPQLVIIGYDTLGQRFQLTYDLQLTPTAAGLEYHASNLEYGWSEEDVGTTYGLNYALTLADAKVEQALAIFRERLAHTFPSAFR